MILVERQARHCRCSFVAREDRTEAEMTIPGMRTSLFIVFAERSRNCCRFKPDFTRICIEGIDNAAASRVASEPEARGKRIVRAALVAADSNYRKRQ